MKQKEGSEKLTSGAKTFAGGILGPPLLAATITFLGIDLGCLTFDIHNLVILAPF